MASEAELLRLIELIYDAAQDPALWPQFLEQYAIALGAAITFFHWHRLAERSSTLIAIFGADNVVKESYHAYYSRLNVWRNQAHAQFVQGRVLIDDELVPRSFFEKSEFYNDYLVHTGGIFSITGVIARQPADSLHLTALRDRRSQQWSSTEKEALQVLLPHVTRAHVVQERLQVAQAGALFLNTLDVSMLFLSDRGELLECNQAAERMLRADDGLAIQNGIVRAGGLTYDAQLQQTIRGAAAGRPASLDCPAALAVPRPSGKRSYQVLLAPVRHRPPGFAGMRAPEVLMLVVDPSIERPSAQEALVRLYGLTRREAALASVLSTGKTVEQAAEQLGITYETARSHLRRVFDKTETSRQTELIILLSRLPKQRPE